MVSDIFRWFSMDAFFCLGEIIFDCTNFVGMCLLFLEFIWGGGEAIKYPSFYFLWLSIFEVLYHIYLRKRAFLEEAALYCMYYPGGGEGMEGVD